jgi:tetratricopeptide (TPR) repeat protein
MFQSFNVPFASVRQALLVLAVLLVAGCGSPEDRAQSYYERGMKLLSQQDYVKASIEFKNALQLKKDLVGAWRGLAQIEERNPDPQPLTAILRTIVELDEKDIEAKVRLARLRLRANALDEALKLVNAADELVNRHAGVLGLKAGILFRLNDSIGATREARAALEVEPANAEATVVLAAVRLARGDAEGALMILDREPAVHMEDVGIQLFRIKVLEQMGNSEQAEVEFRKLIGLHPQRAALRAVLIKYLFDHKRPDDAEKELRAWAAANPANVGAELNLINFILAVKGPAAARQELMARINAGGEVFRYQIALAELHLAEGNFTDGVQLLEKLISSARSRDDAIALQIKLAEIHFNKKNFRAAEALASEILRKDDRNTGGLRLRAAIRMENGQLDAAVADARQALNEQPRSTELSLLLATAYERSGSIELAEKQYADVTRASGFAPAVALDYVAFLRRRGAIARAEDTLTELVNRWPNNVGILSTLAEVRLARQNWAGAQEIADTIGRIGGGNPSLADQILGVALSGRNKYDESIAVFQKAYAAAPSSVQPMVTLVNALVRAGKLDQAAAFLQTVLQSNPDSAEAHVLVGSIQLAKNAPEQALKSFRTAIERQPKNTAGYQGLADLHLREKNNDEALKVIRAGLEQQPDSFAMHLALASVLVLKGDYEAAIAEYENMLRQNPGSLIVANNLASLLADYRTDKASLERAYSVAAILRKSPVPSFKDTLGWVYHRSGDYKGAISLLEEATAALPNRALIRYHLGMTYIATGQLEKASEQLKKASELAPDNSDLQTKIKAAQEKAAI